MTRPTRLAQRLGLQAFVVTLLAMTLFALVAYAAFATQQQRTLERVLERELAHARATWESDALGTLRSRPADGLLLQLATRDGRLLAPAGELLPRHATPTRVTLRSLPYLAATAELGGNLEVRAAVPLSEALAARASLRRSLGVAALAGALLALLLARNATRRALAPLRTLVAHARRVDAADPTPLPLPARDLEVQEVTEGMNRLLAAIRQRKRAERRFLAEVAHELAAPLMVVGGHLEALQRRDPTNARLASAAHAAQELLRTSQDLLGLARGELERPLQLRLVDPERVARQVAAEYPGVQLRGSAPETVADPERLAQAVRNVVRNAVQAAGDPRRVRLRLAAGAGVQLQVIDAGPGIAPERLAGLFDAFRGEARTPGSGSAGGVGVGLGVARDIVERHRGSIAVRSRPGLGTRVTIALPVAELDEEIDEETDGEPGGELGGELGEGSGEATTGFGSEPGGAAA